MSRISPRSVAPLLALLVLVGVSGLPGLVAENWPQWRGPNGDGTSSEKGLPAEWSREKNVAWRLALPGPAGSTPAVLAALRAKQPGQATRIIAVILSCPRKVLMNSTSLLAKMSSASTKSSATSMAKLAICWLRFRVFPQLVSPLAHRDRSCAALMVSACVF